MTIANKLIRALKWPLSKLLGGVRHVETYLGPEDDWIEDDRRVVYEWADKALRPLGRPTVTEKEPDEWTYTVDEAPDDVEVAIASTYQRNILSTRKYRMMPGSGKQWAVGSYVYDPPSKDWQHHIYLFPSEWGGTDIYAHKETSVRDPPGHVTDDYTVGDPDNILGGALREENIEYQRKL